jgi:hypothetical protein
MPKPLENQVIIFRDLLNAGLRFPLDPVVPELLFQARRGQPRDHVS